ncbi:MAG: hypothetical protein ABSF22_02625 [Bryobacteraceae bacterium]
MSISEISGAAPVPLPTPVPASAGTSSTGGTEQSLLSALEASSPGISPTAIFLIQLEQLQKENPVEYAKVAASISTQLQTDAKTAAVDGNPTQANKLDQLATVFDASSQSGQLPTVDALHDAGLSRHHFHGHDSPQAAAPTPAVAPASDSIESIVASEVSNAISSLNS